MEGAGILLLILFVLLIANIPAIILGIIGLTKLKSSPDTAKKLFIAAGIYFIVSAGICGALMTS